MRFLKILPCLYMLGALAMSGCTKTNEGTPAGIPEAKPAPALPEPLPGGGEQPLKPNPTRPTSPTRPAIEGLECAERLILLAAKKNVANKYDNRPTSGGMCALGVRTSLQLSRVGGVDGSLGNAIDYLRTIRPHGYVDSGIRDPRIAPPGSVLVFSGPRSAEYLRTGNFGRPAGTWLGHVTIKGDDGRYYTDGRTREAAMGWQNNRNEGGIRNVVGIFVPGRALAAQYEGRCKRVWEHEAFVSLVLASQDAHSLDYFSPEAEAEGRALVKEGLERLEHLGETAGDFRAVLKLALEAGPFDDEAQLTIAVQEAVQSDRSLRQELALFLRDLPRSSAPDQCKADRLEAELARLECLAGARIRGQESEDGLAARACGMPFAYGACLRSKL